VTVSRHIPRDRRGLDHGSIDSFQVGVLTGGFFDQCFDVEMPHRLFHQAQRIQRDLHLRQVGAEYPSLRGRGVLRRLALPTSSVNPLACRASKRLSTEAGRNATQALTGLPIPLRSCPPRSCRSKRLPRSFRVLSAMTTVFGSAMPWRRAARLGVSPTTACSWAAPDPIRSPTTTNPVAMPTRVCREALDFNPPTAWIRSSPARTALSASSS
jgi:hypothetical protein